MFTLKCSHWFVLFFLAFGLLVACNNGNNGPTDTDESVSEVTTTTVASEENVESSDADLVEEVDALAFLGDTSETDLVVEEEAVESPEAEEIFTEIDEVLYPIVITNTNQVTMTWRSEVMVAIFDSADEAGNWFAVIDGDQSITETVVVDYTFEYLAVAYVLPADKWGSNEGMDALWACALEEVQGGDFVTCLEAVGLPEAEEGDAEIGESEEIDLAADENTAEGDEPEAVCQFEGSQAAFILISEGTQGSTNYVYTDPFWGDITIDSDHPVTMEEATMEDGCLKTGFSIPNFSGPMSLHVLASDGSDLPLYSFHNPTSQDGLGEDGHAFTAP